MEFHLKAARIFVIFDWNLEDTKLSVISLRLAIKCCGASAQDFSGKVQIELQVRPESLAPALPHVAGSDLSTFDPFHFFKKNLVST
jgi:hypothetical protein